MKAILGLMVVLAVAVLVTMFISQYYIEIEPRWKLFFIKPTSVMINERAKPLEHRVILAWNTFFAMPLWFWDKGNKGKESVKENCTNYECVFTIDKNLLNQSNMILFHLADGIPPLPPYRIEKQPWVFLILEPPIHTHVTHLKQFHKVFNLSISYRIDSDIHLGYGWRAKRTEKDGKLGAVPEIAQGRTQIVIWFVSNCHPKERKAYVSELAKYVPIDIFGRCGKPDPCNRKRNCTLEMRRKYKFCIAFENSRCIDYISEKYWFNVRAGCVPIVLGPTIENYNRIVPPDSFIHVDNFTSPKELASYIKYLDQNHEAYYKYHMWRHKYHAFHRDNLENKISLCDFCSVLDVKPHEAYNLKTFWGRGANCNESKSYVY